MSVPIATDGSAVFRQGQTVPVKFSLAGESSRIDDLTARLYLSKVIHDVAGDEEEASSTSSADTGNSSATTRPRGNLGTRALRTGTWQLRTDLGDGTLRTVRIGLR